MSFFSLSKRLNTLILQIWNLNANLAVSDQVLSKVHSLLPDVNFLAEFYKRKYAYWVLGWFFWWPVQRRLVFQRVKI